MHVRDLQWFRDNVAIPKMRELLENTTIPEGMCCIDNLEISFLDGRSYGVDSEIKASGFLYKDGRVEEYSYQEQDVSVADFAKAHKDCVFISDGKLNVWNELEETELKSRIRCLGFCAKMFPELSQAKDLKTEMQCIEYLKMQHLYQAQQNEISGPSYAAKLLLEELGDRITEEEAQALGQKIVDYAEPNESRMDRKDAVVSIIKGGFGPNPHVDNIIPAVKGKGLLLAASEDVFNTIIGIEVETLNCPLSERYTYTPEYAQKVSEMNDFMKAFLNGKAFSSPVIHQPLDQRIQSASSRASTSHISSDMKTIDNDLPF